MGFEWNRKVAKYEIYDTYKSSNPYIYHVQFVMNHLSVPATLRIYLNKKKQFFVNLGASMDLNLYSKKKHLLRDDGYKKFNAPNLIFMVAGVGYEFKLKKHTLVLMTDYKYALNHFFGAKSDISKHRYARILIGLRF